MSDDKKAEEIAAAAFGEEKKQDHFFEGAEGYHEDGSPMTEEELIAAQEEARQKHFDSIEPAQPHPYTDEELKKIASGILHNQIFTDRHINEFEYHNILSMIFMPIMFMGHDAHIAFAKAKPALFFEYYDKANPRGVNGYPVFMSFSWLSAEQFAKVQEYMKKIKAAMEAI